MTTDPSTEGQNVATAEAARAMGAGPAGPPVPACSYHADDNNASFLNVGTTSVRSPSTGAGRATGS